MRADVRQAAWLRLAEHLGRTENPVHIGAWLATPARRASLLAARSGARTVPMGDTALLDFAQTDEASPGLAGRKHRADTGAAFSDSGGGSRARC
jgi:DNA-directed RNA polymerase specialized sigma24 family protein